MHILSKKAYIILLVGDASVLYFSVWGALSLRYFAIPNAYLAGALLISVTFLFVPWFTIFYLAGLYGRYTTLFKKHLPNTLFGAQTINVALAALLFFVVPFFKITPKTILIIYLFISTGLLYLWRVYIYPQMFTPKDIGAVLIGDHEEAEELVSEVGADPLYPISFKGVIHPSRTHIDEMKKTLQHLIDTKSISIIVADPNDGALHALLPFIYSNTFVDESVSFMEINNLYQEVFGRVPLSLLGDRWLLTNLSFNTKRAYEIIKRLLDIVAGCSIGLIALLLYPFIVVAIKLEDGGDVLIKQDRVGKNTRHITLYKFRSMTHSSAGKWIDAEGTDGTGRVTKVGALLRKAHIDELPQAFNIIRGDISLIGPRPDMYAMYDVLKTQIPFYTLRYGVTPGLTGWAQTTQIYRDKNISPQSIEETRTRLQYDLYYIQNKSAVLDMKILLKTFKVVLFGRAI